MLAPTHPDRKRGGRARRPGLRAQRQAGGEAGDAATRRYRGAASAGAGRRGPRDALAA